MRFQKNIEARIVMHDGGVWVTTPPVTIHFAYDESDPLAVSVRFPSVPEEVVWEFARDLLREALEGPRSPLKHEGRGDVFAYRTAGSLAIHFRGDTGEFTVITDERDVKAFYELTTDLVPLGHEWYDLDTAIDKLLA